MDDSRCHECGAKIIASTAVRCGALCMPCFKQRNRGRTPTQLEAIAAAGLTDLDCRWHVLRRVQSHSDGRLPDTCLFVSPEIAGCLESFLAAGGGLDADRTLRLRKALAEVEAVIPSLSPSQLPYFTELRTLVQDVIAHISTAA